MVRYCDLNNFLKLSENKELNYNFKHINSEELKELFDLFNENNTTIYKQIGFYINPVYKGKIITTSDFGSLEVGDIIIIKNNDEHYSILIEEVSKCNSD